MLLRGAALAGLGWAGLGWELHPVVARADVRPGPDPSPGSTSTSTSSSPPKCSYPAVHSFSVCLSSLWSRSAVMTELTLGPPPLVSCRESDNGHPCDHLPARSRAKMKIKFLRSERELKQVVVGCLQQSITRCHCTAAVVIVTSPVLQARTVQ